jgi:hypothetical protein
MKLQLLYQKVYFKSNEWKELISFISSLSSDLSVFLLSKNIFLSSLKEVKEKFLGECVIVELVFNNLNFLFDIIAKIQSKYSSRFFLVGFLWNFNNKIYFLKVDQMKNYFSFYNYKKKNNQTSSIVSIHSLVLYDFMKFLKLNEVSSSICLSFLKTYSVNNFSYYY